MAKQWVKQQMKQNELRDVVDRVLHWILDNRQTATIAASVAAVAVLVGAGALYRTRSVQSGAWERLSFAQNYAYSGRPDVSLQQIKDLTSEYPNAKASAFANLFAGDLYYHQGLYKEAAESYQKVLDVTEPRTLIPFALANVAMAQEAGGQYSQSAATAQRFLDTYSDHFLAPQVYACLGRSLQAAGQADQAKATFQKMSLQFPDTPWAGWAQNRLTGK